MIGKRSRWPVHMIARVGFVGVTLIVMALLAGEFGHIAAAQSAGQGAKIDQPWVERVDAWKVILTVGGGALLVLIIGVARLRFSDTDESAAAVPIPRLSQDLTARDVRIRQFVIRVLIITNLLFATYYIAWRYTASVNWQLWVLGLALLAAETYSFIDTWLMGTTMWKWRRRFTPPAPRGDESVDVLITCYNESVEMVEETARAALKMTHPCEVYICDDGNNPTMRAMAARIGCHYIVRSSVWDGMERHAKAGNLINALEQTEGEFLLILDADQVPEPQVLSETLGYFADPQVAFVQTPQWFKNVPEGDPFGSQAPLFYGPIQEAKDGWNAAFFCGSNAVLRRDALVHAGLVNYARDLRKQLKSVLNQAAPKLKALEKEFQGPDLEKYQPALTMLQEAVSEARDALEKPGVPLSQLTYRFQRQAQEASRQIVREDFAMIAAELDDIPGIDKETVAGIGRVDLLNDPVVVDQFATREHSPLQSFAQVQQLLLRVDVDRAFEATPVMPLSTISVTEDMATAMRLHGLGHKSIYHPEVLVFGLAPEDLGTALQQRLRWAQGTIQVMLRENPLTYPGSSRGQKLMYFSTMWSYLSGFFAVIYLIAPVLYLTFGWLPVAALSSEFFWRFVPFLAVNQILFAVIAWGLPTWRGQQYSLALFPLWIKAVTSAVGSVYFGKKLGFVVTPKTRQKGSTLHLIRPQLVIMALLVFAIIFGVTRLAMGIIDDTIPVAVNVMWAVYDLAALSVVLRAALYRPAEDDVTIPLESAASVHGRAGTGGK